MCVHGTLPAASQVDHGEVELIVVSCEQMVKTEKALQMTKERVKCVVYWGNPKQEALDVGFLGGV